MTKPMNNSSVICHPAVLPESIQHLPIRPCDWNRRGIRYSRVAIYSISDTQMKTIRSKMSKFFSLQPARPGQSRFVPVVQVVFLVSSAMLISLMVKKSSVGGLFSGPWTRISQQRDGQPDMHLGNDTRPSLNCALPTARYDILTGQTTCYPSSGGIWMAELGPIEIQYLRINRFESTDRSWNQTEDQFCDELRPFGGSFYLQSTNELRIRGECSELDELEPAFSVHRQIAFPETGGVWVLEPKEKDGMFPRGMAAVRNALSMEERSTVLERFGAVFCEDIVGCPALDDLSKEPFELAERVLRQRDDAGCAL